MSFPTLRFHIACLPCMLESSNLATENPPLSKFVWQKLSLKISLYYFVCQFMTVYSIDAKQKYSIFEQDSTNCSPLSHNIYMAVREIMYRGIDKR